MFPNRLAGELGIGHVTLKFDTGNPDWSEEAHKEFGDLCRRTLQGEFSEAFGPGANRVLWSAAEKASEIANETFVEVNPRNESFTDVKSFVYDEPPVSGERNNQIDEEPSSPPPTPETTYTSCQSSLCVTLPLYLIADELTTQQYV